MLVEVEGGQDHHLGVALLDQPPARLHPVQPGHADVHEHHVGTEPAGLLDGLEAVGSLPDDLEVLLGLEHQAQAPAHHRFVVGEQQADHRSSFAARTGSDRRRPAPAQGGDWRRGRRAAAGTGDQQAGAGSAAPVAGRAAAGAAGRRPERR